MSRRKFLFHLFEFKVQVVNNRFCFRLKDLESKLAERDAMIRVLQKHTFDKEAKVPTSSSYPSISLGRSPRHTPHASLNTDLGVLGCSVSREELGKLKLPRS